MHHCLCISEIVSMIMDFTIGKGNERTVANFAIACRAFQEPALDVLWRAHFTLEPLIKSMPDDLWEVVDNAEEESRLRFRRRMVATDFTRWKYYAPRIRCLGCVPHRGERSLTYIDPEVINAVRLEPSLRLSNLRQIFWAPWNNDMFSDISPFIGSAVTHFSIICEDDDIDVDLPQVLLSLSLHCPSIQQVNIPHYFPVDLSSLVNRWDSLTYLKCVQSSFTADGLAHLACLPNLARLDFLLLDGVHHKALSSASMCSAFPALEKLSVATAHITLITSFLDMVHSCRLRKICIYLEVAPPLPALQCFLRKLGTIRSHAIFDHLEINDGLEIHDTRYPQMNSCVVTPQDLEPLFSLKNIRHLSIDLDIVLAVDNAWLEVAASTWPHLHYLQIEDRVSPQIGPASKITPVGLPVLAHLRELQFLMVRIDTRATNWSSKLGICSTTVKTLRLDGSNIKDPLTDFRHLLDMFPRVNCVGVRGLRQEIRVAIEKMLRENKRQRLATSSASGPAHWAPK